MPTEALEARAVCQALDDEMQMLLGRPVAGLAQVEALPLPALPAADVDVHAERRGGAGPGRRYGVPVARFLTPLAAARKPSRVPEARTPTGTACPSPAFTTYLLFTRQRFPSGDASRS